MKEHYKLLDFLKEHDCTDIQLRYLTNFSDTKLQKRDIFEEWKIFKNVSVHASLDGTYARGEYQRKGQKWDQVLDNRKRMVEEVPHVEFYLSPTISVFNIFHIPDFHKEWVESGLVQLQRFLPDSLKNPNEYSMKILPLHMKKQLEIKYREYIEWILSFDEMDELMELVLKEFNRTIDFMYSEDWFHLIPKFIQKTNILDKFRDENILDIFPELVEMYTHAIIAHPNDNITLL
ncbi:MAG: hypothetical protein ACI94Y_000421 [Maribacter sp.]|jgi:hypothetical protein